MKSAKVVFTECRSSSGSSSTSLPLNARDVEGVATIIESSPALSGSMEDPSEISSAGKSPGVLQGEKRRESARKMASSSSSRPPLETHLIQSLKRRNFFEVESLRPVVESYLELAQEKKRQARTILDLEKRTKALAEEKETLKVELLNKDENEGKAAMAEKLDER